MTAVSLIQDVYAAFGRGDVAFILDRVSENVDWEFVGSPSLPYAGRRTNKAGVADFFAAVAKADTIHLFEPREYIATDDGVVVLGHERSTTNDTATDFESDWIHLFTVKEGIVTRWRGFFNTAARYGL